MMRNVRARMLRGASTPCKPLQFSARRAAFLTGRVVVAGQVRSQPRSRPSRLDVHNFKFLKDLGLKKPGFLPDFGLDKRKAVLDKFYTSFDADSLDDIVSESLKFYQTEEEQSYTKEDWITLISECVKPAIPDFSWSHRTTGEKDEEGYSMVKLQAVGHHSGKAFTLPKTNLPPVEPTGQRFRLAEQSVMVKIEDGKVAEIRYLPRQGTGPLALYRALGGKIPSST